MYNFFVYRKMRRFEWDEEKNRANFPKHKISSETETTVFDDPFAPNIHDVLLIVVAHTWTDHEGDDVIRLISARKATRGERKGYEESQR
jgi:uncharacterized DUF497 family protein